MESAFFLKAAPGTEEYILLFVAFFFSQPR